MVNEFDNLCSLMSGIANVDKDFMLSPSRKWPLPACRGILYMYFRKQGMTTTQIGRLFNRDHATVLAGTKRTQGWLDSRNPYVSLLYNRFKEECQGQENEQSSLSHLSPAVAEHENSMI